jgi:2-polyprenyl-3-methyl-5-hydroxy-6-metoxy-1,4-benzoquinol methylase
MLDDAARDRFVAASHYRAPVDIKKLGFVFRVIADHGAGDLDALEIACGVGGVTLPLATVCRAVRALDIDAGDVAVLNERARELGFDNVLATVEDAFAFDDGRRYDVVVASEVFEHLTDPGRLADVAARQTKPGGVLIVTTPNGYGPWEMWNSLKLAPRRWNWLRRLLGKGRHDGGGREHEQRYTRARLTALFTSRGFELAQAQNSDFIFTLVPQLRHSNTFGALDTTLGDLVPHWMASGWYLAFTRKDTEE